MRSIAAMRLEKAWAGLQGLVSPRNPKNRGHLLNQFNTLVWQQALPVKSFETHPQRESGDRMRLDPKAASSVRVSFAPVREQDQTLLSGTRL
jgi:hypothetical protein